MVFPEQSSSSSPAMQPQGPPKMDQKASLVKIAAPWKNIG